MLALKEFIISIRIFGLNKNRPINLNLKVYRPLIWILVECNAESIH